MNAMQTNLSKWQLSSSTALPGHQLSRQIFFFNEELPECARNIHHVYAPVKKHGIILEGDAPWESGGSVSSFCNTIIRLDHGRYRLYYTVRTKENTRIAVAESDDGMAWEKLPLGQEKWYGHNTNRIVLTGIPGAASGDYQCGELTTPDGKPIVLDGQAGRQNHIAQPQVLRLPDGRWRMYYWHHQHGWGEGPEPYTIAESEDGLRWHVPDFNTPALNKHTTHKGQEPDPASVSPEQRLLEKQRRTNDANYVYWNSRINCFEQFSQYFLKTLPERKVKKDNQSPYNRMIQRRVSEDGISWSSPELVIQADQKDPQDLQFYYLAIQYHDDWLIGSLGHYRAASQTMDMELVFSRNGRTWERPLRGGFIARDPQGRDAGMIQGPNAWIDQGDRWLCLYTANARKHNQSGSPEFPPACIMAASWNKHRFAGLRAGNITGGFMTPVFFPRSAEIKLDGDIRGWLRAELCDGWGRRHRGYDFDNSVTVRGDDSGHILRWKDRSMNELRHEAVRLRLEFTDADIYRLYE